MKRRGSAFDELILLPWPLGVVLGVVGFLTVRFGIGTYFSSHGNAILQGIGRSAADGALTPLAWMVLVLCWLAALVSFVRSRSRRKLLDRTQALDDLRGISWARFEQLVGELFRRRGYSVEETGLGGADGGIDLVLRKGRDKQIVQCKQWKSAQVGVRVVRELYGLLHDSGASHAWIVCCGDFTADARRFVQGKPLSLITAEELLREIAAVRTSPSAKQQEAEASAPACERCGSAMLLRKNRRTGEPFWGCSGYPECRGTRTASTADVG